MVIQYGNTVYYRWISFLRLLVLLTLPVSVLILSKVVRITHRDMDERKKKVIEQRRKLIQNKITD